MTLYIRKAFLPSLPRENDRPFMDFFIQCRFSVTQLKLLNACRFYLQVIFISDITTTDGKYLLQCSLSGLRDDSRSPPWNGLPNKIRTAGWKLWRSAFFKLQHNGWLISTLGRWLNPLHQQWSWYSCPFSSLVFFLSLNHPNRLYYPLLKCGRITHSNIMPYYDLLTPLPLIEAPPGLYPCSPVYCSSSKTVFSVTASPNPIPEIPA